MKKPHPLLVFAAFVAIASLCAAPVTRAYASEDEKKEESKKEDGKKEEGGKKDKNTDITGGRFDGDPIYVHLTPLILPAINDHGAEQLITLVMDVEVKDMNAADNMHSNMPRVRDSLLRNLYGGLGQGALRDGKLVNINKVKSKAAAAVGEVIGHDNVKDVLIVGVSQRLL